MDRKVGLGAVDIEEVGSAASAAAAPSRTVEPNDTQAAAGKAPQWVRMNYLFLQFACCSGRHLGLA